MISLALSVMTKFLPASQTERLLALTQSGLEYYLDASYWLSLGPLIDNDEAHHHQ